MRPLVWTTGLYGIGQSALLPLPLPLCVPAPSLVPLLLCCFPAASLELSAALLCCSFADIVLLLMHLYSYTVLGVPACVCLSMCLSMRVSLLLLWLTGLAWIGWAQLG